MTADQLLFALLRTELCDAPPSSDVREAFAVGGEALAMLAEQHDLVPLIADALVKQGLLDTATPTGEALYREQMLAVFRYEQQSHEQARIEQALVEARIAYLPLKGAVVRAFYPEPWMRTSCDIDILVHEQDVERAIAVLDSIGFCAGQRNYHDISLRSKGGTHLELHFTIKETLDDLNSLLSRVWEFCSPAENGYCHTMTPEFFFFHTLAHMAHHFVAGGCGIRPFLDLWIWRRTHAIDEALVQDMCKQSHIFTFYEVVQRLIAVWLEGQPHDDLTRRMQAYLLHGGAYGSIQAQVAMKQQQKGGKFRYALSRLFLPYDMLRHYYPVLEKHKWLYPLMQVRRWGRLLVWRRAKRSIHELATSSAVTAQQAAKTAKLLQDVGFTQQ